MQKEFLHYFNRSEVVFYIPVFKVYDTNADWLVKLKDTENVSFRRRISSELSALISTEPHALDFTDSNNIPESNEVDEKGVFLNMTLFEKAVSKITYPNSVDSKKLNHEPVNNVHEKNGIFLLWQDRKGDNHFIHNVPFYIMVDRNFRLFLDYTEALDYGRNRNKEFSVWEFVEGEFSCVYSQVIHMKFEIL